MDNRPKNRLVFTRIDHDGFVTLHELSGDASLDEACEAFKQFLLGCGYVLDPQSDIHFVTPVEALE